MALASQLIAIGIPPAEAEQLGYGDLTPITATGTTQGTAFVIKPFVTQIEVTASPGSTGLKLPADVEFQQDYLILNSSSTTASVYPPTGCSINGGSANAAVTIGQNVTMVFSRLDRTRWIAQTTAGTLTGLTVATANGFAGSVSAGPIPQITLSTTQTGTIYGDGTALSGLPGTTTTVLHGNASGAPTFSAVNLAADVSGTLPVGNGGWGTTTAPAGRQFFALPLYVADLTALAAVNFSTDTSVVIVDGAAGRNGTFVKSTSNLSSNVTADPQQGIYVPPASAPTGASGAWVRVADGSNFNVLWFGADATGTNDCAAAVNSAYGVFSLLGRGGMLVFPSGKYKFLSSPAYTFATASGSKEAVSIMGAGSGGTLLDFIACDGLVFNLGPANSTLDAVVIRDATIATSANGGYKGVSLLRASAAGDALGAYEPILLENVDFRGDGNGGGGAISRWDYCVYGVGVSGITGINCNFWGGVGTGTGFYPSGVNSPLQWSIQNSLTDCNFANLSVGVEYGERVQGITINNCSFTCGTGIHAASGLTGLAGLWVNNCNFGGSGDGIYLETKVQGTLVAASYFGITAGQYGIRVLGIQGFTSVGNYFWSTSASTNTGIYINGATSASQGAAIAGNIFALLATGVSLSAASSAINVGTNLYSGVTTNVSDLGTGNIVLTETSSTSIGKGQYLATATNDSATAGNIGQEIQSNIASGSQVAVLTATATDITSIDLTAGDWDVDAMPYFQGGVGTNYTFAEFSISTTSATRNVTSPRFASISYGGGAVTTTASFSVPISPFRVSLASTTTFYLVAFDIHTVSTSAAFGQLRARRVR